MRGDRLARQWRIVQLMSRSHAGLSASEIAEQFGVKVRAIYRDLEVLQRAGFPFYTTREGRTSRWKLTESFQGPRGIPLTLEELKALELVAIVLRSLSLANLNKHLESILDKVQAMLPAETSQSLAEFKKRFKAALKSAYKIPVPKGLRSLINSALRWE